MPISDKVLPFFEYWYNLNDCEYLLSTPEGKHFEYRNYYDSYWKPLIEQLGMSHRPHDTRHTCISLLAEAGVDDRMVKKIVGHKGQGVTQQVYTHFENEAPRGKPSNSITVLRILTNSSNVLELALRLHKCKGRKRGIQILCLSHYIISDKSSCPSICTPRYIFLYSFPWFLT